MQPADAANQTFSFDIPSGDAALALASYARQADKQIIAPGNALTGVTTPALRGTYDAATALAVLLKGTGLSVVSNDGRTIVLIKRSMETPAISGERTDQPLEVVTVTGYRASLRNATAAKREAVGVTDSIFAEDIGKFPDTNLAESLNRIPGIILTRDANDEGIQIAVRGLGTNFTKILLNSSPIAVATPGIIDISNNNRETDLNMFPGEMFTSLTVYKTPKAEFIEGGIAGVVNMRTRRPFDQPGENFTYLVQGIDNTITNGMGHNGALIFSDTGNTDSVFGEVGLLVGVAMRHTYTYTAGWEDGNAGWVTPTIMTPTLCGAPTGCDMAGSTDSIGGNSITIAPTVPANVAIPGYPSGSVVDATMLRTLNSGLTTTQISNMLLPRFPRTMYQRGTRDRFNVVTSLEIRPSDTLSTYIDAVFGSQYNNIDRSDMGWGVRAGDAAQPMIPMSVTLDSNGVVTSGTFANAQFGLEARTYDEAADFTSIDAGFSWHPTRVLAVDFQANASRSHFLQQTPTILVATCPSAGNASGIEGCAAPSGGVQVRFANHGGVPSISTNIDLDKPANFQWSGGRVQLRDDKRYTATYGAHLALTYGGDAVSLKTGLDYDVFYRSVVGIDVTYNWQQAVCGSTDACTGAPGSLIPQSALAQYLRPGPAGFVAVNYPLFRAVSNYYAVSDAAVAQVKGRCVYQAAGPGFATATMTGGESSCFEERTAGAFAQLDGTLSLFHRDLTYDVGLRWIRTRQSVRSPVQYADGHHEFSDDVTSYQAFLPGAELVYHLGQNLLTRVSVARTMSRANISNMIQIADFGDITAQELPLGNPSLKPYFANDVDIGLEYYTGGEGYVSAELYRKWISGFTATRIIPHPYSYLAQFGYTWDTLTPVQRNALFDRYGCTSDQNCPAIINVREPVNSPGIETITGLELSYVQPLDPLLRSIGIRGFGVAANVTFTDQSSTGSAAVHAQGVAPYTYNVTGYYENDVVMARLSYAFTDRTYNSGSNIQNVCLPNTQALSADCPQGAYIFGAPFGQADFSSSLKLSTLFGETISDPELTFSVQNVFDAKLHTYFQYTNAYHTEYMAGRTILFGIHGTF